MLDRKIRRKLMDGQDRLIAQQQQDRFTTCFKTCGTGSQFRGCNGMLRHSLGGAVIFIFLKTYIVPILVLLLPRPVGRADLTILIILFTS